MPGGTSAQGAPPGPGGRVAVTGGAGFIGSHLVDYLVAAGRTVLVIDDLSHPCGAPLPATAELVRADCGSAAAATALRGFRPGVVVHLAARGGVAAARRDAATHARAVLGASVALYTAACEAGASVIVSASSGGAVYGDAARLPTAETDAALPRSAYGAGKLAEEAYLGAVGREHGVRTLPLRFANVYGPRQDGTGEAGLIAITCHRLLAGLAPQVVGDGAQTRDFVFVHDVVDAVCRATTAAAAGPLNIGTGISTSVTDVVEILSALAGSDLPLQQLAARSGEVRHARLAPGLAGRLLDWTPRVDLRQGLRATLTWFAAQPSAAPAAVQEVPA